MKNTLLELGKEKQDLSKKQKTKVLQRFLQQQLQILKLRKFLSIGVFSLGAAALRVPMQIMPSVEPISFFALLSGWLFGKKEGFITGASALYFSNFIVFGGQGPWTIFQALGFGLTGFLGGFIGKKARIWNVLLITIAATIFYETIVNIGSIFMYPFSILTLFITAIPFGIIHLVSNTAFSLMLPKIKNKINKKGEFNKKEIYQEMLKKMKKSK